MRIEMCLWGHRGAQRLMLLWPSSRRVHGVMHLSWWYRCFHEKTEEAKLVFDLRLPDFLSACLLAVAMRGEYQRASSRRAHERMRLTLAEEIFT